VVVEPGDALHVEATCESVVGEVGSPGLVGLVGLEPDIGGLGSLGWFGNHGAGPVQDPVDRGPRHGDLVAVGQVPGDGVGTGVQPGLGEFFA
jgi:hypothetical protein